MQIREFLATVVLASFFVATASMSTRAQIVFDEEFNFREFRFNPPPNYTQGPDLLGIGISVIDITTGQSPAGALVGSENLNTGDKFFLNPDGPVEFFRFVPYSAFAADGAWRVGVTSDVGSATAFIPKFGLGPGTGRVPGVSNLAIAPGSQPFFSWGLPPALPGLNDGNINRIRARIFDSNGRRILNATVDDTSLDTTSYLTPAGVITHNGAFVGAALIEGFNPFNRTSTFETFVVENVGTAGQPVSGTPFYFRDNTRANSVQFGEGDRLTLGINVDVFNDTFVYGENDGVIVPLSQASEANRRFEFASGFAFDQDLADSWTVVAWNGSNESVFTTQDLTGVGLLPFVDSIRMLPDFLTPTVLWDLPPSGSATFDNVQIGLFDDVTDERLSVFGPNQDQLFETLPANATSYSFEPGALDPGRKYVVRILLREANASGANIRRSLTFFNFSPIQKTSSTPVYLPSLDPGGVYNFDFDVRAGFPVLIDPEVAIGYHYEIGDGDPRFSSVSLPDVGDGNYEVIPFDGAGNAQAAIPLTANEVLDFTDQIDPAGIERFLVLGIESSAALDPTDVTAFMTTLTFVNDGHFTGTMTPIIETLSTALDLVAILTNSVQGLVEAGNLENRQGKKLNRILSRLAKSIEKERIGGACRQLDRFNAAVERLIQTGTLDQEDGEPVPLLEQTAAIDDSLAFGGCPILVSQDDDDEDEDEDDE